MGILWYLALMIFSGMLFGRLAKLVKLPNVTGYLVAGLLLGPCVLGLIPQDVVSSMGVIPDAALGFIAFSVGSEFKLSYIKQVGMTPIVIACLEALGGTVFVTGALIACGQDPVFSIMLGAIAAATAPAATIMVIRQYEAKGPVTQTLLTVVALDDAAALMLFGIATAVAQAMLGHGEANLLLTIAKPIYQIFGSLLLGGILGMLFLVPLRFFKKQGNRLSIIIGMVFLAVALANFLDLSALLVCMALGMTFVNISSQANPIASITDGFTPPLLMLFFVLSGAQLELGVLPSIGVAGCLYVISRVIGKLIGAWSGAKAMKAPPAVAKYLGPSLVPQAGVAIGLSLLATQVVPEYGSQIRAIILCATMIYELVGPFITKTSLKKAGEIAANA